MQHKSTREISIEERGANTAAYVCVVALRFYRTLVEKYIGTTHLVVMFNHFHAKTPYRIYAALRWDLAATLCKYTRLFARQHNERVSRERCVSVAHIAVE